MGIKCPKCQHENPDDTLYCGKCATPLPSSKEIPVTETLETPKEELTTGSTFAGRYQIIEELGKGGMGKVYRVLDKELKEEVALKLIKPEIASDKKTLERFSNEIKLAHKISHRNVCRMFHLGEEKGTHFITMEYVPGEDLRSSIRRFGQLPVGKSVSIAKQICEGLSEAHRLGIVHRDLKPQNVMIDKEGNARIMDFGIARSVEGRGITGAGVMIGTPEYMSPEQVEGKETDQRSDIYSLGVILYETVTGRVPFEGDTPFTIGVKHKSEIPRDPRELNTQIPEDLSRVILRCIEKDKEKRYQNAGEVHSELDKIEKGIPTTERVVPKRKPITSREITVTFGLKKLFIPALVVVALVMIGVIIWQFLPQKKSAPPLSGKPSLAVMYFENRSGLQDLDKILVDMLTTNLSRYEGIEVVSSQRLFDILNQMGKQDVDTIDKKTATEVAARAGVRAMLLGSIMKIGDRVIINSHLTDVQSGAIIDSTQAEGSKIDDDIFGMVDKLTAKIGLKMGVAPEEKDQELKIADVTTSSLEAYQYYQKGLEHFWRWKFQSAEENFQKAVDIDSAFAMAYLWLAWAQARMGWDLYDPFIDATPFKKTIGLAKKYSQKATERERLLIDMGIAFFNFDIESFKTFCKRLVERYPKEKLGYLYLGNAYWFELDYEKAKEAVEKALELDPTYANSYNQLAYMNALLKDRSGTTSAVKKYNAVHPDVSNTYHSAWETHAMLGMFDEAQGFLEEGMKRTPEWRSVHFWLGINHLLKQDADKAREEFRIWSDYYPKSIVYSALDMGCSYLLEGKYMMAVSEFRRGVESAQRENDKNNEMLARINLGRILVVQRKYDEAIDEYKEAEKLSLKVYKQDFNPDSIFANYLAGIALVYKGDYKAAQDRADAIKSIMQKGNYKPMNLDFYHLLLGELYTAQKNPKAAQREINKLSGWAKEASPRYKKLVAVINEIQGDFEKAVEEYRNSFENWLLINPTVRRVHLLDFFDERSKVDYNIAKIYEKMGKTTKAIEHYEKFLDLWKDADPGMVEVEDAKKRLAGLNSH